MRFDEALASYDRAIALKPDYVEAFLNRGIVLEQLKRLEEAVASYNQAIALNPKEAGLFYNRGNALKELKRLKEAVASYDQAIALEPDYADAFYNRGNALLGLRQFNAHTTASDALWSGLPVLTCRGKAFAGRVAASLLMAVGLPELLTDKSWRI